jgi:hypothetical protein
MAMLTVCGTLLTTPFVLDYDLTSLAFPLAWLLAQGRRGGFLPNARKSSICRSYSRSSTVGS